MSQGYMSALRRALFVCTCVSLVVVFMIWFNDVKQSHDWKQWRSMRTVVGESNETYKVDDTTRELSMKLLKWNQAIPPTFRKFIPLNFSNHSDFVMIPNADFWGYGDYRSFKLIQTPQNLKSVLDKCNQMSEYCKAFTADLSLRNTMCYIKKEIGIPQASTSSLFIKKTYLDVYLKVLLFDLKCVNPNETVSENNHCKIPALNPWAKDILHLVPTLGPRQCDDQHIYTELNNKVLRLREERKNDSNFLYALAEPIIRGDHDWKSWFGASHNLTYSNNSNDSKDSFIIDSDLWKVTTHLKNNTKLATFHLSVVEKPEVLKRMPARDSPLNIFILTFDGTSEAHFRRMLPRTYHFIKHELRAFMFKGYSVVGDATLPNMNAMLTGIPIGKNRRIPKLKDWPLIFKDLKNKGFATMYSEDQPGLGTFTLTLPGFDEAPTDHYARPLWEKGAVGQCLGGQFQPKLQLDYILSFIKSYKGRRKFSYTHMSDLCHRKLNLLSTADVELLKFFKILKNENLLNESLFVIMGDHGARFGEIRSTYQGKLEERLPMLAMTLPSWFQETYKDKVNNFQRNTQVITSPFDLHATFEHLLDFSKPINRIKIGKSLFEIYPEDRQCADAGISDQWCPCLEWIPVDHTHEQINASAARIVSWMNQNLAANPLSSSACSWISLKRVLNAVQNVPKHSKNAKTKTNRCSYQIQLETSPGDARFEVTIDVLNDGSYIIYNVSRINAYGNQAACIESKVPSVRKYCYCI